MRKPIPLEEGGQIVALQALDVEAWENRKVAVPINRPLDDAWFELFHADLNPITFEILEKAPPTCAPFNYIVRGEDFSLQFRDRRLSSISRHTYALAKVEK